MRAPYGREPRRRSNRCSEKRHPPKPDTPLSGFILYDGSMNTDQGSKNMRQGPDGLPVIPARSILSGWTDEGWFGSNYNMNLYKGCSHGCIYCDSRSECYQVADFDTVRTKADALAVLEQDLRSKRRKGVVISGSMSDAYNPFERSHRLMRGALERMDRHGFGVVIDTKSPLVARDLDVLLRIARHSPVAVNVTVTTADDALCRRIERQVAPTSVRLAALRALAEAGIRCGVLLMPILPFVNDTPANITDIVRIAHQAGAGWIYAGGDFGMTLRQNQRTHYLDWLDRLAEEDGGSGLFAGLRNRYETTYGQAYHCRSPRTAELLPLFTAACREHGMVFRMPDIVRRIRAGYEDPQLSLFDG